MTASSEVAFSDSVPPARPSPLRWSLGIIVLVLVVVAVMVTVFLLPKTYSARALILVEPSLAQPELSTGGGNSVDSSEVTTQSRILASRAVADLAKTELGTDVSAGRLLNQISTQIQGDTRVFEVRASGDDAKQVADIANAFAKSYLSYRTAQQTDIIDNARTRLNAQAAELRTQVNDLSATVENTKGVEAALARSDRAEVSQRLSELGQQLAVLDGRDALSSPVGAILRSATTPSSPSSPKVLVSLFLALVAGSVLGGLVMLLEGRTRRRQH